MISREFNEERVNEAFRKVRNRLRKHYPQEIVANCILKLNEHPADKIQHMIYYAPWKLLLLIKWTFIFGEYLSPYRKKMNTHNFSYLLNMVRDFEGTLRLPSEYENIFLFFRNVAFQQFWLQREFNMVNFARQNLLFGKLDENHPFKTKFYTTKLNTPTVRSRDGVLPAFFGVKYNMRDGIGKSFALCLLM